MKFRPLSIKNNTSESKSAFGRVFFVYIIIVMIASITAGIILPQMSCGAVCCLVFTLEMSFAKNSTVVFMRHL